MNTKSIKFSDELLNFIPQNTLLDILYAFTLTTDLTADIVDIDGRPILFDNAQNEKCKFCKLIMNAENGRERCENAYKRAGKQAVLLNEPYIFRCPAGLIEWAAPLIVENSHLGTIICGQVLMWEPEDFFWVELREMNKNLEIDYKKLFKAVDELPVLSAAKVQAAAYLLYVVANYIVKAGWEKYEHIQQISKQQSLLYREIENRKILEAQVSNFKAMELPFEENVLLENMLESKQHTKKYIEKSIAALRCKCEDDILALRVACVELLMAVFKVARQVGVSDRSLASLDAAISSLYQAKTTDELSMITSESAGICSEYMQQEKRKNYSIKVIAIMKYIDTNYAEDINLDTISEAVFLNSNYAGRLFKKGTGQSMLDYLLKVRMEKAKDCLKNPHYQIGEIAKNIGYEDVSYFSKVFKKYEGISPSEYRKMSRK